MLTDQFWGAVAGAAIAGVTGVGLVFLQRHLERQARLRYELLQPCYDRVQVLLQTSLWDGPGEPPRKQIQPSLWYQLPSRFLEPLNELSALMEEFQQRLWDYQASMSKASWFEGLVGAALSDYLTPDRGHIDLPKLGVGSSIIQVSFVATGVAPYAVLYAVNPAAGWPALRDSEDRSAGWAKQVCTALETKNPRALELLFSSISKDPLSLEIAPVTRAALEARRRMIRQAWGVSSTLSSALHLRDKSFPASIRQRRT